MKTLNERATEILKALLAVRAKKLKIKNASQTIHVKLTDCIGKYNLISLTQHIEINGVLFRDPEVKHEAIGNRAFAFVGSSGVQMGWLASQADMLADDWHIVK